MEIKVGDVVQLKSGGIAMTVAKIRDGKAECHWMRDKVHVADDIDLVLLKKVDIPTSTRKTDDDESDLI